MDELTYPEVGATAAELPAGYHHLRRSRVVGRGRGHFRAAADLLMSGGVQRRAGAAVIVSDTPLRTGSHLDMRMRLGPLTFDVPCRVVWADRSDDRCGFAYGTLSGHPERGEERFELVLHANGDVVFEITAFSRPARWYTRLVPPVNRWVQSRATDRYLAALQTPLRLG